MENVKDQIVKIMNDSNSDYWESSGNEMPKGNEKEDALIDKFNEEAADKIIELFQN